MPFRPRVFLLGLAVAMTGCVSMGRYHALQGENDDLRAQLDQTNGESAGLRNDLGATEQSNNALSRNKTALEAQAVNLEQSEADLANQDTELTGQKASLERERAALLKEAAEKQAQYDSVMGDLNKEVSAGLLKITRYRNMLTLDVADEILFDSGKAALKPDGEAVLREVGKALAKSDKIIRVVGDTDNVPLDPDAAYASNWELSTARATTVVRFLQDRCGLNPADLVAEGRGQWDPVAPNDTPEHRQRNRRIEITLIDRGLIDGPRPGPLADAP
jgi:chemotaxis protein MotB